MKRFVVLILAMCVAACASAGDDPWSAWPYRLRLRVTTPELADATQLAHVCVNLGPQARGDCADVRILDDKGREQPWRLVSSSASRDVDIVFRAVRGVREYTLIFGNPKAKKISYNVEWNLGKTIIDDFLPKRSYIHGLWSWVKSPVVSGVYAHTSPVTDRFNYHGVSEIRGVPLYESTRLNQYVLLDENAPPQQIVLRLVFERRSGANVWEKKNHVNLYWGARNIKRLTGRSIRMGDLPAPGKWHRLSVRIGDLLRRADFRRRNGGLPDLFGLEFCTDRGRAVWDLTTIADVPGSVAVVSLKRKSAAVKPTFVYERMHVFKLGKTDRVLSQVRFHATAADRTKCRWGFGGVTSEVAHPVRVFEGMGVTSEAAHPVRVFEGADVTRVSLVTTEPDGKVDAVSAEVKGPAATAQSLDFAIEMVSSPFIVRADGKALFNLRLEGTLRKSMALEACAVLLDPNDTEIRTERAPIIMLPGLKHPTFKSFSLDVGAERLSRIRFEVRLGGRLLADRVVTVHSSRSALAGLKLAGDRYLDRFGNPAVIRCELGEAPGGRKVRAVTGPNILVIGDVPAADGAFGEHLAKAIESSGGRSRNVVVRKAAVETLPEWSLPFRQAIALSADDLRAPTEVVVVASATRMMLTGIPARTGADAIGVMVDQIRRQSDARVLLLTPAVYSGHGGLARQYTVALRLLGIEKNVTVIDAYSRSMRLTAANPELLKTAKLAGGRLVQQLHPRMVQEVISAIIEDLKSCGG